MPWHNLVSAEQAAAQLENPRLRVFDCRYDLAAPDAGREAWRRGHLPGAIHADLHHDLAGPGTPTSGRHPLPTPEEFGARLRAWGVNEDSWLLAYDDATGLWAARFWWMTAKWLGHPRVAVLDGGLRRWLGLGLPVTTADPPPRPQGDFAARPIPGVVADADATAAAAAAASWRVLDARAPERYRGEIEPIDAVAGHIPGARNHPTTRAVGPDGTFLSAGELQAALAASLDGIPPERTIAYCGSGVTACHLLLALEHAGLRGARLYPGSWSEWSRSGRDVAVGSG